ncbi:hypothetical protein COHA_002943 [Chlorella ohadii]|uniref:Uncharacterized protein n=1 Tax=Chlorella ohadii TaxID=2649997 RepID=A0AAD5DSF6_9CHLO|nr:hypothetical protein COHA_002943 [Chlorella ohadii]
MEDMEQRAAAPVPSSLNSSNAGGPQAAAAGSHSLDEQPARTSAPSSASAQQLCEHFSHLLQASGAGLEEVQQQLAMVQQAETAAQRMEAAAMQAALAGVQAAAQAAELSAPRQLDATKRHAAQPTGERSCGDKTAAAAASAQAVVQELHTSAVLPLAVADQAEQPTRPRPSSPAAVAVGAAAMLAASGGKAEEQPPHAEHSQRAVPPAELLQASADGSPAAAADAAPDAAPTVAAESLLDCACADSSAEPAEGWPVQWQPPVVPGIPLQLPPAAVQQMWAVPAASSCLWQPASALMPGTVAQAAPQLGAGLCWGQPVPSGMHQLQQEAAVQWEPPFAASHDGELPFSVASDEELPDSPNSSTCASPASVRSGAAAAPGERGVDFEQQDIDVWGDEQLAEERQQVQPDSEQAEQQPADAQQAELQQAKQQQAMLDELAAVSIQQYQQHAHLAEDVGCDQLRVADGAWDAAAAGAGSIPPSPEAVPAAEAQAAAAGAGAAPDPCADPAAAAGGRVDAATCSVSMPAGPTPPFLTAHPAPAPPRPPAPYQPLKAAAEAAAAVRQREEAEGWRRLRQRADELALWHEYAAQLGISMDEAQQAQQAQQGQQMQHSLVPPPAPLTRHDAAWTAEQPAVVSADVSWGIEQRRALQPVPKQQRLWRPLDNRLPCPSEPAPAQLPAALPSPLLSPSCNAVSSCSDGSGTPASSSCLASEESSSLLSSATTSSSLGVGARHKARALRYRLLRRRLEQATGLRSSLPLEFDAGNDVHSDAPTEADCLSPLATASPASLPVCPLPSGGSKPPRLRRLQEQPAVAAHAAAVRPPASLAAAAEYSEPPAAAAPHPQELRWAAGPEAAAEAEESSEGSPSTAAAAADVAASPPFDSHLADHLSSATPSECPTLGSRVPGGAAGAGEAAAGSSVSEQRHGGRPWRRISDSSCSTLREVSEVGW